MGAVEKLHGKHAKEYEKVLKTISNPLGSADSSIRINGSTALRLVLLARV